MSLVSFNDVRLSYGIKPLLEHVSFVLEDGEKVGVIGANGAGKTTLLRLAAGEEKPDAGRIFMAPGRRVAFLPQRPPFDPEQTVLDAVFDGADDEMRLLHDYEDVIARLDAAGGDEPALAKRLADLSHRLDVTGGWDLEADARALLSRLGLADLTARVGTLSGGQRKRIALARVLLLRPDLLILDEPTNHLDADTVAWLERYLARFTGALLLVTHDRYFLDRVTGHMLEVDRGAVQRYEGNYTRFLELKDLQSEQQAAEDQKRASLMRHELAWLRRGAKARTTKQKARVDRAEALLNAPKTEAAQKLDLQAVHTRLGTKVVDLDGVTKAYDGRPVIEAFSHRFTKGERVGIVGPNGAGKTTLLDLIAGRIVPDSGTVETGSTVVIGYYDQESRALGDDLRVIEYVKEAAENIRLPDGSLVTASQMLERFLFPPAAQYAPVGLLSGGERRRLYLLRLLMTAPNVLLLDEPTNDLDIPTLVALERFLDTFAGTLVVVSHDRYFLDRTVEHVLRVEPGGTIRDYPGDYTAYLEAREREDAAPAPVTVSRERVEEAPKPAEAAAPRKLSFKERQELDTLEGRIEAAEAEKADLEAVLAAPDGDYSTIAEQSARLQALTEALERDVERWAALAERA